MSFNAFLCFSFRFDIDDSLFFSFLFFLSFIQRVYNPYVCGVLFLSHTSSCVFLFDVVLVAVFFRVCVPLINVKQT